WFPDGRLNFADNCDDRRLAAATGVEVAIDTVVGEIQPAVGEPARPRGAARGVEHAAERLREADAEILDHPAPVPLRVVHRAALELLQRVHAQAPHEPGDLRALDVLRGGPPNDLLAHGGSYDIPSRMSDNVRLDRDGAVATVTLNRPDRRNSLSDPMLTELRRSGRFRVTEIGRAH